MAALRGVKGMNDVLPEESPRWHALEAAFRRTMDLYGFREIRTPLVEATPLFVRAIGEVTDVVEKEMYSFEHHAERLTLRPEGTAGVARAFVEHSLHARDPISRLFYMGPMFRAERPQRGRYRQFHQIGAEVYGDAGPGVDAEMIDMLVGFLGAIGVPEVRVIVNSIGGAETRARFRDALVEYLTPHKERLSPESQRRLVSNPLRILDSKSPDDRALVEHAPSVLEVLSPDDRAHFDALVRYLDALGTPYEVDPRLVRGLDYYTRTLFEIKAATSVLGAGDTVVGGGRYDGMIEDLSGPSTPAVGFAAGVERLLLASTMPAPAARPTAYLAPLGPDGIGAALGLAKQLRGLGLSCEGGTRAGSAKSQLRRANALGAEFVLLLGETELRDGTVTVKDLGAHEQWTLTREEAIARLLRPRQGASGVCS